MTQPREGGIQRTQQHMIVQSSTALRIFVCIYEDTPHPSSREVVRRLNVKDHISDYPLLIGLALQIDLESPFWWWAVHDLKGRL